MRSAFASYCLPEIVVSDYGTNFVSSEFKSFLQKIWHQAHYLSTLPPQYKWSGGASGTDL